MGSSTIVKIDDSGYASAEFEMLSGSASIIIQDALSGEQYDSVIVTKSQSRDLDDLF